ncbi:MAG: 5-amino-6-(D-ribitylamino)uracil--L-tyrosine 4-hydroxyphenyl transferase CofH [Theionarchaea archaeon]|nr:MAG: FO synthase subunit 2 [Theionarchaea archaeon DG-70]MBU7011877.1 5-amino-6-(D-ribitylamino)uracil--L-tyrosine 4-hydroxyphenyl transferase CofH [Theionarchaea archaeon]
MNIDIDPVTEQILDKALSKKAISRKEAYHLMRCTGDEFHAVMYTADLLRRQTVGDVVTFVVNRNINFTNICEGSCRFCNFRNNNGFLLSIEEIVSRAQNPSLTEVCIQGGLHPDLTIDYYIEILEKIKQARPEIHIHAFSPAEVDHMGKKSQLSVKEVLTALQKAGLDSMPGTAAEILNDSMREKICPEKISTEQWVNIIKTAHYLSIPTTATIMYGHIDSCKDRVDHIFLIKEIQKATNGFTEFIPLTFLPVNELGQTYHLQGATGLEDAQLYAVSRIVLNDVIPNVQVSWVKLGRKFAQVMLLCGANDIGGTLYEENISKASGSPHGEVVHPEEIVTLIKNLGRIPVQRDTLYKVINQY